MKALTSPIIVIGMHRSGTTLLSRVLELLGLFQGARKERNNESRFFISINNWILHQCGASWDNPDGVDLLLNNLEVSRYIVQYIEYLASSPRAATFLGLAKYMRYRSLARIPFAWGWKDPRNTITLPLWAELFPDAKILHICRHGVDVANSLVTRQQSQISQLASDFGKRRQYSWLFPNFMYLADTFRTTSIDAGFALWVKYMTYARRHLSYLPNKHLEIKYEDFLAKPDDYAARIASFCNLDISEKQIQHIITLAKPTRAYAYSKNDELLQFSVKVRDDLSLFGY